MSSSMIPCRLFATVYLFGVLHTTTCYGFILDNPSMPSPMISQHQHHRCRFSPITTVQTGTTLEMAKGGVHGKKKRMLDSNKKKKAKNPNRPSGKHRKTSKRDQPADGPNKSTPKSSSAPKPKLSILGDNKASGPPWQVLGEKDMKKNVETEKVRRERIKLGLDSP